MKLESQVCSLELAKQLKELGVPQDSLFYWLDRKSDWMLIYVEQIGYRWEKVSAFTVAELGEMFSNSFNPTMSIDIGYNCCYYYIIFEDLDADDEKTHQVTDENEANCRAQMLVWLIQNKYLDVKDLI